MKKKNKKNILIINANPKINSFGESLSKEYAKGAKEVGNKIKTLNLKELKLERHLKDTHETAPKLSNDLLEARKLLSWADHLVFVYPIWWGSAPAILKEFFETLFTSGFAYQYSQDKKIPVGLMGGKSARIIATMDSPKIYFKLFGELDFKLMKKYIFNFCGIKPVKKSYFGSVKMSTEGTRNSWAYDAYEIGKKEFK